MAGRQFSDEELEFIDFWRRWSAKWHRRITCLASVQHQARRGRRLVRASDIQTAWIRMFMPAVDAEYVLPDSWLALTPEEQRAAARPEVIRRPKRITPASERGPGFSLDDVGPYWKLSDGTVLRDQASARDRLWRQERRWPGVRQILDALPARTGSDGRIVRGRTPERVLDALVSYGLVHLGMTQVAAARYVLDWTNQPGRSPKKYAEQSRLIWEDLHLPPVKVAVSE